MAGPLNVMLELVAQQLPGAPRLPRTTPIGPAGERSGSIVEDPETPVDFTEMCAVGGDEYPSQEYDTSSPLPWTSFSKGDETSNVTFGLDTETLHDLGYSTLTENEWQVVVVMPLEPNPCIQTETPLDPGVASLEAIISICGAMVYEAMLSPRGGSQTLPEAQSTRSPRRA